MSEQHSWGILNEVLVAATLQIYRLIFNMGRGTDVELWAEFNPPMQLICHDNFGKITNGMSTDIFSEMENHWYFFHW